MQNSSSADTDSLILEIAEVKTAVAFAKSPADPARAACSSASEAIILLFCLSKCRSLCIDAISDSLSFSYTFNPAGTVSGLATAAIIDLVSSCLVTAF